MRVLRFVRPILTPISQTRAEVDHLGKEITVQHRAGHAIDMYEYRAAGDVLGHPEPVDFLLHLCEHVRADWGSRELDFTDIQRVEAGLNQIVDLTSGLSLSWALEEGVVVDHVGRLDAEKCLQSTPIAQHEVFELQPQDPVPTTR